TDMAGAAATVLRDAGPVASRRNPRSRPRSGAARCRRGGPRGRTEGAPPCSSVKKCDVPHCLRALLGVREHAVPAREVDRRVVGMANRALGVQLRVADHPREAAAVALVGAESLVGGLADAREVALAHPHDLTAAAERELQHVRLATATAQRLVADD